MTHQTRIMDILEILNMRKMLEEEEKDFIANHIKEIPVDSVLKDKIRNVCEAVKEVFGSNYEWIGYLLGDDQYIVREIFLPYQVINKAFVKEDQEKAGANLIELEEMMRKTGYRLVGWIHSHGGMSPFHSSTDDRNTYGLVRFIGYHSKRALLKMDSTPKKINKFRVDGSTLALEGEKTVIKVKLNAPRDLIRLLFNKFFIIKGKENDSLAKILSLLLNYSDWWFFERKWIAPVYSVVTNASLDFYGEIWIYDSEKEPERVNRGDIVRFVELSEKKLGTDYSEIMSIVREKMRLGHS